MQRFISSLLLAFAFATVAQAGVLDGLLNYYNFDGNFNDTAGSLEGNASTFDDHGSQPGFGVEFADAPATGLGQYGLFFGDDEAFVEVPDSADISHTGVDLSISAWVQVGTFDQGWQAVVAHGESADYRIARRGGGSNILSYAGGVGDIPTDDTTGPNVNDGNWHHVVAISPFGAPAELYVNGALVATGGNTALADNGSGRLMIGGNPDTAGDGFRTWDGGIDEVAMWNRPLTSTEVAQIYAAGAAGEALPNADNFSVTIPPFDVAGRDMVGMSIVDSARSNLVFAPSTGDPVPGLGQAWYAVANPGSKGAIDGVFLDNEPVVPYFHSEDGTWWSGSDTVTGVVNYPIEVDGIITGDNYSVKLDGEILIEESGTYRFLDGVDDFTFLAIDTDRSGIAGDSDAEVLINDNDWTNALSTGNGGAPIVSVDIEGIEAGGEWLAIEFNMAEGGGGDSGTLYWDYKDGIAGNDDIFPVDQGEGVADDVAAELLIPESHLRGPAEQAPLVSGDVVGAVPPRDTGWEIDVNPVDGTSDTFTLENPDADLYTTVLDVDGVEFHINPLGDVEEGASFKFLDVDEVSGTPIIATEGWSFDPATGSVVFGAVTTACNPNTMGDIDGSGDVAFADFLILSQNFGQTAADHTTGDIDCSGDVAFADFLILSQNFGQTVGGAESVPEPSGLMLLGLAGLLGGLVRRRR